MSHTEKRKPEVALPDAAIWVVYDIRGTFIEAYRSREGALDACVGGFFFCEYRLFARKCDFCGVAEVPKSPPSFGTVRLRYGSEDILNNVCPDCLGEVLKVGEEKDK